MCKMMISPWIFFHFYEILIFWVVRGVKGQKVAQNKKLQLHLSRAIISGTVYHVIIIFGTLR